MGRWRQVKNRKGRHSQDSWRQFGGGWVFSNWIQGKHRSRLRAWSKSWYWWRLCSNIRKRGQIPGKACKENRRYWQRGNGCHIAWNSHQGLRPYRICKKQQWKWQGYFQIYRACRWHRFHQSHSLGRRCQGKSRKGNNTQACRLKRKGRWLCGFRIQCKHQFQYRVQLWNWRHWWWVVIYFNTHWKPIKSYWYWRFGRYWWWRRRSGHHWKIDYLVIHSRIWKGWWKQGPCMFWRLRWRHRKNQGLILEWKVRISIWNRQGIQDWKCQNQTWNVWSRTQCRQIR